MADEMQMQTLTVLTGELARRLTLEQMLRVVVDRTAVALATPHAGIHLVDGTRTRVLISARAGEPRHTSPVVEFRVGEGLIGWIVSHARNIRVADAEADGRFQPRADLTSRLGAFLGVPLLVDGQAIGVLAVLHPDREFTVEQERLLELLAAICAPRVEIARLSRLAQVDALTGALNRHGLEAVFPGGDALSVVMADIDHFKLVNDTHGHAAGDEVLVAVARLLSSVLRAGDTVVRWGGEEFLLLLPGIDVQRAAYIAERARKAVEESALQVAGAPLRATVSLGVAARKDGEPREVLFARADAALYAAKQRGRNQVALG